MKGNRFFRKFSEAPEFRTDDSLEFALYRLRDDEDYDLVAVFVSSGCSTICNDGESESLQFHAGHELLSNLEMDDQSEDFLLVAGNDLRNHAPSVLEKES